MNIPPIKLKREAQQLSFDMQNKRKLQQGDNVPVRCQPACKLKVMIVIFAVQLLAIVTVAWGAGGTITLQAGDSQPGKQEAKASVVDSAGKLIVTGYQNLGAGTDDDYLTVKFNADGTVAWRNTYNRSGGSDQATAIAVDGSNNVVVTGFSWNGTNYDIYTAKYDGSNGNKLWDHVYNAPAGGNDIATSISVDSLNNVYVGGYVQNASGNEDYIIIKYNDSGPNPDGTPIWTATWNGAANGTDKLWSVYAGIDGIAATGQSWNGTDFDVMTIKYDYTGAKVWEKRYSTTGTNPDIGRKVVMDQSGNLLLTASAANGTNIDIYTAKYASANGNVVWERTENKGYDDEPFDIVLDPSGNAYVTGYTFTLTGHEDLYIARYRGSDGIREWEKTYDSGSTGDDIGTGIALDAAGNVYVTGYTVTTTSNINILTIKFKGDNGTKLWDTTFDNTPGKNEKPVGIGIGAGGVVLVGGWSDVWTLGASNYDFYMLQYDPGLLLAPSGVTATIISNTSVRIDWTDNSINEDGFIIQRKKTDKGVWSDAGTVGANVTTFTDTGLDPSTTYYYRVKSFNAASGSSNPSEEVGVITLYVTYASPAWSYIYNSPDNKDDFPHGIAVGPDNNPVITGYSMSTVGGFDYYTLKMDRNTGTPLWSHRYDDADSELDVGRSVVVDSTNAATVTGYSSLYYAPAAKNVNSIYTMKYPSTGPLASWHSQYNGPGGIDDRAQAIASAVDGSNNVAIVGYGKNASNNDDIYLIKYTSNPSLDGFGKAIPAWSITPYDGGGNDYPSAVAFDKDGNIFITGYRHNGVNYDIFTAKYNGATGAQIWADYYSTDDHGDDYGNNIAIDSSGNVYVTGSKRNAAGNDDIFTIKYDGKAVPTNQRVIWTAAYDAPYHGDDRGVVIRYDQVDDSVVVAGTVLTAANDRDYFIIRYDSNGNEKWKKTHLRPLTDDAVLDMAMDISGNVCLTGYTSNGVNIDAMSVKYNYEGTLIAATIFNGAANGIDEGTNVTINSLGETFIAGYTTNAAGNADYLVYKGNGPALQASVPFTVSPYYTKMDLAWTDTSTGEEGFYLDRKVGSCNSANPWVTIYTAPPGVTTYTNTGLNVGEEYCYRVRSFKTGEVDPRWVERYAYLSSPVPPGNLIATVVNTTRIDLTWQDNTTGETGFRIFRCSGTGCADFTEIGSVASNVTLYSDTSASANTTYSYRILSFKTADWQSQFSSTVTAVTPAPATPSGLTAIRASEGQINLSWSDTNTDETGFKIERCLVASCSYTQIDTVAANITSYSDIISLIPDTAYRYRIRAYKTATAAWDSAYSNTADATATLNTTAGLTATAANTTTINLAWSDVTGSETGFRIERCPSGTCNEPDFVEVAQTVANATVWIDTGVCNGTTYTYRVKATNTGLSMGGNGTWTRRKPLAITNFQPAFQTRITIPYDTDMQADFRDIRFYDETTKREIPYYLESKTNGSSATLWIKTGAFSTISLYYGNPSASNSSSGANVFELFDDFDSLSAWTVTGSSVTASGGIATVDSVGTAALYRNFNIAYPYISETSFQYPVTYRDRLNMTISAGAGSPTGYDIGIFDNGQIYWNGWTGVSLAANAWYTLQWEVTNADYAFRVFDTAGTQLISRSHGSTIADIKRAYFSGTESGNSDFKLDWFRIRKYAATVPTVVLGAKEQSAGYVFDNIWTGQASNTASVTTPTPTAPTAPSATRVSEARIDLAWTDTTSDESGFRVERCKGDACTNFAEIGTTTAGATTYNDTTPLDVDSTYRYQVRAYKTATCNGGWNGPYSAVVSAVTTLNAPSGVTAAQSVGSTCDDLRVADSDGTTLLNYWVESGCNTAATSVWVKLPTLPAGARQLYLYWGNPPATAMSSPSTLFDFFDDFTGTTIDGSKWVKTDPVPYLSQNNELIASGGNGIWGTTTMYSVANFARPFILELKHKLTGGNNLMFGIKDTSANTSYGYYHHAIYPQSGTNLQVYESGSYRGASLAPIAANVWEYYKIEALSTGAKYYVGTSPASYGLFYTGSYSSTTPLKIGLDNLDMSFRIDDIRVRGYASPEPTAAAGIVEFGSWNLTGGAWSVRRPITVTNAGTALANYQVPVTLDTTATASDRITVQWTDNTASETGFIIERCTGAACDFSVVATLTAAANATSYVDKTVALGTTYCYRVKADKSGVWTSAPSNSACATTTTVAAPVLTATATTKIDLSWTNSTTGEDVFVVERCQGATCDFTSLDPGFPVTLGPNVTAYEDTSVCPVDYRYRVKSFKSGPSGWSVYSNTVNASTTLPTAPSGFSATRVSELQVALAWTDNTGDETGFKVERCEGTGCSTFSQIADLPANTVFYNDINRAPNTTYRYRVKAYKGGGCGWETSYSAEQEVTTSVSAPSGLTLSTPYSTQVNLAWADNTTAETGFKVERCETAACSYAEVGSVMANTVNYSDTSACAGTNYTYRVRAVSEGSTNSSGGCWSRRKPITVTNFQPNFLVLLTVAYDSAMKPNFDDIRIVDTTAGVELPYWIENKTDSSTAAVWIKTGQNSSGLYLYYGNPSATSSSSMTGIFGTGLMAYYPFSEANGTTSGLTYDKSGTGNDLTLSNFSGGYGVVTSGAYGNMLSLNGSNNYAALNTPNLPTGSLFSVEAWIYPKGYPDATYNGVVSWGSRGCNGLGFALSMQNSGRPSMPTWCNDYVPASGAVATLNAWNHVAAVLNGQSASLYMNGQLVGTTTLPYLPNLSSVNLAVGMLDYPGRYFNGYIDEVRIYNRALTAQEIAGRYAATIPSATLGTMEVSNNCTTYAWTYASAYSATAAATTPILAAPTAFTATRANESQVNLAWTDGVTGETALEIDRCTGATCDFSVKTTFESAAGSTSYADVGLTPDTTYRYRIRAKRVAACTAYSAYAATVQATTTLIPPSGLTATALDTTQVRLSWTDTTGADNGFKIERCEGSGCTGFSQIDVTPANATTYTDATVCSATVYRYQIRASNAGLSLDGGGCWTRRKPITVTNFQPDFQTRVVVAYASNMKSDFSDIRFHDPVSNQELPYWIENKTDGVTATVWVKTRVSSTIYLYYGNATATSSSSGAQTFQFFDDFSGTAIDAAKWATVGSYFSQNNALISSGGSGNWDSGIYSIMNFPRPFVFEVDHYHTGGNYLMIGTKDTSTAISYVNFPHAAYAIYDGSGNRLAVYEDGNNRGDNKKTISSGVWQYYKLELLPTGANFYHGASTSAYTNFYTSAYSSASPLKIGFANHNQAFRFDNARVRKYASPEPTTSAGAEEQSACFAFASTYNTSYSNIVSVTPPAPVAPTLLTATAVTDTQINLAWTDQTTDESRFRIEQCSGDSCSSFSEVATVAANTTSYSVTGLAPSTTFCFRVRADKTAFCTNNWPTAYTGTSCDKSFAARSDALSLSAEGPFKIRLSWHDLASDEDGYEIEVLAWNGKWVRTVTTGPNITTYLDTTGIEPLKTYTYRIRPYRGTDKSPYMTSAPITTPAYTMGDGTCP